MTDKPKALALADDLDTYINPNRDCMISIEAATELRRLHEVNQALVEALESIDMTGIRYNETPVEAVARIRAVAVDALAKAKEST